jgi:hypothetical protein
MGTQDWLQIALGVLVSLSMVTLGITWRTMAAGFVRLDGRIDGVEKKLTTDEKEIKESICKELESIKDELRDIRADISSMRESFAYWRGRMASEDSQKKPEIMDDQVRH